MKKEKDKRAAKIIKFWRDVFIAAGQITFGIIAAIWFVPPFGTIKAIVLILNGIATFIFLLAGYKLVKNL